MATVYPPLDYVRIDRDGIHCCLCDRTIIHDPDAWRGIGAVNQHRERCYPAAHAEQIQRLRGDSGPIQDGD